MIATVVTGIVLMLALQTDEASRDQGPGVAGTMPVVFAPPRDMAATLDGRVLVVRRYADWESTPDEFELLSIPVEGNRIAVEPNEAVGASIVVVTGEDQKDEAVKKAVGDAVWVERLTKGFELWLPFPEAPEGRNQPWQFTDALGEPLIGAVVETWLAEYRGPHVRLGRTTLDRTGRLTWRMVLGELRTVYFVVSHPDYGCAEVHESFEPGRKVIAPLVRRGTVAAERAIHGRVVDPNGAAVPEATIVCSHIRTLGAGVVNRLDETCKGITDARGVFSFYLPNRKGRDDRGELIPPKSQYQVRIAAPKALGFLPRAESIENGREVQIVLERPGRARRLRFEDQNGTITDRTRLEAITVALRRPGRSVLTLQYDDWKDGAPLPPGTWEASMNDPNGECRFEPVELTQDSPGEVVFRLAPAVTYYGRVVHGITGRPMPGAFVLAMTGSSNERLNDLTIAQWDALHALAGDGSEDDAALDPLRKIYGFVKLVRTDATGGYGIALEADESFYGFITFEQDYLAVMHRRHALKADAGHFAEVPTIGLFPAATVFVEAATDKEHLSIMPKWEIDEESRPAWVKELLDIDNGRESSLEYDDWLKPNTPQAVHVPAGVSLRLRLETPYDEEFCPVLIPQMICLVQGQSADLGRFTFERAIPVQVRAVDSAGQPIEGIPIRTVQVREDGMTHWGLPHNTDEQGLARFHVVPHSTGSFGVFCRGDNGVHLRETVDYTVAGHTDAGREFVLRLSDEMLVHLLK